MLTNNSERSCHIFRRYYLWHASNQVWRQVKNTALIFNPAGVVKGPVRAVGVPLFICFAEGNIT